MPMTLDQIGGETSQWPADVVSELVDRIMLAKDGGRLSEVEVAGCPVITRRVAEIRSGQPPPTGGDRRRGCAPLDRRPANEQGRSCARPPARTEMAPAAAGADPAEFTTGDLVRALRSELWSDWLAPENLDHFKSSVPADATTQPPCLSGALLSAA
jgi:hypothetical protein